MLTLFARFSIRVDTDKGTSGKRLTNGLSHAITLITAKLLKHCLKVHSLQ